MTVTAPATALLVVKVFAASPVTDADLRGAQSEADAILRGAGVRVAWTDCSLPRQAPSSCAHPPAANELLLRVATGRVPSTRSAPMGTSLVGGAGHLPVLATLFTDPIAAVAHHSGVEMARLLGRVAAHEIGHLLLNCAGHARDGIMRPMWSLDELRHGAPRDWAFSEPEAKAMRAAVEARVGGGAAPQRRNSAATTCS